MIEDLDLKLKVLRYLEKHPDAWTIDVHKNCAREMKYWEFRSILLTMAASGVGITFVRHTNKNLRWRIAL